MALLFSCLIAAGAVVPVSGAEPVSDPPNRNAEGWTLYRSGRFAEAAVLFGEGVRAREDDVDARTGLGFALLQTGDLAGSRRAFERVLAAERGHGDARQGLAAVIARGGGEEVRFRPDADHGKPLEVPARALADYLEIGKADGGYTPFFVKGVNLGAALPGKFPTEFPRDAKVYRDWLETIAGLGANAVRLYTLFPPEFYEALDAHNRVEGARRLWLIQGVWTELPDRYDFADRLYLAELHAEVARVIDAVHGDLAAPPRPGHASGHYAADASPWLLAYILGREWEPFAVKAFDAARPEPIDFTGVWFRAEGVRAMEAWVAALCDFAAGYEARRHRSLHPLTFANWPTLDPLAHPSESNRDEEDAWKDKYGIPRPAALRDEPWENDAVSVDATRIVPTAAMAAGFFAAYHVYPNYPDFIPHEGAYEDYLRALKRYHGRQPLMVAEFGISTSRGVAHVATSGWHHGGIDERRQGELVATMLESIRATGCAGGVVFEFMDEWFKGTWSTSPLEIPAERRRLWFNAESPEESYGLIAHRPKAPEVAKAPVLASAEAPRGKGWGALRALRAASDAGYFYLRLETEGSGPARLGERVAYRIGIDTYDRERGETVLGAAGIEFVVDVARESRLLVSAPYEPYRAIERGPVASPRGGSGTFVPLMFEANRERIGRDGTRYPAIAVDRGALRDGADVTAGNGAIDVRIPWALLNVTDPSERRVLHQETEHEGPLDTTITGGFRIYAFAIDPRAPEKPPLSRLPVQGEASVFAWPTWETPAYVTLPKAGLPAFRKAMQSIPDAEVPRAR